MAKTQETKQQAAKFAGIEVPPELTKTNFLFLYINTAICGLMMAVPAVVQPAFLNDVVKINQDFTGSINGLLQNMSQIATLAFVAMIGVLSDKVGRKILAFFGFLIAAVFYFLMSRSDVIAGALQIPAGFSGTLCSLLSFMPGKAEAFSVFAPGLLMTYITRFIIGIGLILAFPQFITMVADYTYTKDRGKGMAMNGVAMGVASMLAFAVCAPIQKQTGVVTLMTIIVFVGFAGAACTWLFLKDRMPEVKEQQAGFKEIIPVVRQSMPLKASYLCTFVTRADIVVMATFVVSWGVKYGKEISMAAKDATMKASLPMITMSVFCLVAFPVIGILLDRWGRLQTLILSLACAAAGMIVIGICPNPFGGLVYVGALLCAIGMAGSIAGANTLASDAAPVGMLGAIFGGMNTMQPVGILLFVGLGGYLFDVLGPGWAFILKGGGTLVLLAWILAVRGKIAAEIAAFDKVEFTMPWTEEAQRMLKKVPGSIREVAVQGTEQYAKDHGNKEVTPEVMKAFREEMGV